MIGPVLFKIGNLPFYTYGIFLVLGVVMASVYMFIQAKRQEKNTEVVFDLVIFTLLAGIVSARATYFIIYRSQFNSFTDLFRIQEGGLVSWGGFAFAIATFLIVLKIYKEKPLPWLDVFGISAVLGLGVGRLGSFLSGEFAGKATDFKLAIDGVYPVTLYESIILIILFVVFAILYQKKIFKKDGYYFFLVLLAYSLIRFVLDFLRVDSIILFDLTMTQIISSAILFIAVIPYIILMVLSKKRRS